MMSMALTFRSIKYQSGCTLVWGTALLQHQLGQWESSCERSKRSKACRRYQRCCEGAVPLWARKGQLWGVSFVGKNEGTGWNKKIRNDTYGYVIQLYTYSHTCMLKNRAQWMGLNAKKLQNDMTRKQRVPKRETHKKLRRRGKGG